MYDLLLRMSLNNKSQDGDTTIKLELVLVYFNLSFTAQVLDGVDKKQAIFKILTRSTI